MKDLWPVAGMVLAAVTHKDGRIEVFTRDPDSKAVLHTWQTTNAAGVVTGWFGQKDSKGTPVWDSLGHPGTTAK